MKVFSILSMSYCVLMAFSIHEINAGAIPRAPIAVRRVRRIPRNFQGFYPFGMAFRSISDKTSSDPVETHNPITTDDQALTPHHGTCKCSDCASRQMRMLEASNGNGPTASQFQESLPVLPHPQGRFGLFGGIFGGYPYVDDYYDEHWEYDYDDYPYYPTGPGFGYGFQRPMMGMGMGPMGGFGGYY